MVALSETVVFTAPLNSTIGISIFASRFDRIRVSVDAVTVLDSAVVRIARIVRMQLGLE